MEEKVFELIESKEIVLLEFSSPSCAPCLSINMKIKEFIADKDIEFLNLPVEENRKLAADFGVFTAPTVICFVEGKVFIRESGYFGLEDVFRKIERYICILKKD